MRENTRTFTVTDSFSGLLRNIPADYCDGFIVGPNYVYPVVGKIGMDRMINDFVNLTLFGALAGPASSGSPTTPKGPPTMVDQLKFTTKFNLTTTPKVVFSPVRALMDASIGITATRQDIHTVTVGLAIDTSGVSQVAAFRALVFSPGPLGPLLVRAQQAAVKPRQPWRLIKCLRNKFSNRPLHSLLRLSLSLRGPSL
jgi:hypothetical protein